MCVALPATFIASGVYAGEVDSLSVNIIDEAVVTGTRNAADPRHLSQTVTVVDRGIIEEYNQSSLIPILSEQVPGLFITSRGVMGYGVSGGAAGSFSLRGLSGGSARMMVLIDGHPQYAGIFGHPISDAYQSMLAEKVEVLRGPASVLYGSNAMGGVVNIVTRRMSQDGMHLDAHVGYGSYNTLESEFTGRFKKDRLSAVLSGSYDRTDGHRENMPFEKGSLYGKLAYELTHNWRTYADVDYTLFDAAYPGPVSAPLLEGDQRIGRGVASFAVENSYERTSGAASFFYNWGKHWINDGYTPSNGESPKDGRFNSFDDMMGLSLYQSAELFEGNRVTVGADWFRYGGSAWTEYVKGEREGTVSQIVDKHENELAAYVDLRQHLGRWITLNAGLRADHHSRVGTEWVPQVGLSAHLPYSIEIKASAAKGFRYPTLREMYMFPPQNPDLKPESMWNYELALSQTLLGGALHYGVNLFHIDGKNTIMTLPNPSGSGMLNQNSGEIHNSGVELQSSWRIDRHWSADANYSFLHMETPVLAAPEHKLHVGGAYSCSRFSVSTGLQYVAGLYTSLGTDPGKESFLLWNARASYRLPRDIELWVRGDNLLSQKYEINAGYPMPGATVMVGVNVRL